MIINNKSNKANSKVDDNKKYNKYNRIWNKKRNNKKYIIRTTIKLMIK